MVFTRFPLLVAVLGLSCLPTATLGQEPTNLSSAKTAIFRYHDSGQWTKDLNAVEAKALRHVKARYRQVKKPAIVLDVDDTSLSMWDEEKKMDFGYVPDLWGRWEQTASAPAIAPTLKLFRFAKSHGIAVFFVTGRRESSRTWTVKNLEVDGFTGYKGLFLRPAADHNPRVAPFKSGCRKRIAGDGYSIIANLGDQESDLKGGFSERSYKLPNPMYFIP